MAFEELARQLETGFHSGALEFTECLGQHRIAVAAEQVPALIAFLKAECGFDFLVDFTAVDYPEREARFELVYTLYSFARNERVRVSARVDAQAPSLTSVFAGADWLEREVFDMFGVVFTGHPDLKRILLPDGWEGHPLRKEYPIAQPDDAWVAANLEML